MGLIGCRLVDDSVDTFGSSECRVAWCLELDLPAIAYAY